MWLRLKINSLRLLLSIEIMRWTDHIIRTYTGLPTWERSEITPQLYLGGQYGPHAIELFNERGITGVVNMRTSTVSNRIKSIGIKVLHLPTRDLRAPSIEQMMKGIEFIKDEVAKGGKVYVHCRLGEGRGPTMAMAYLIGSGMLYEDAYSLVKKIRPYIRPTKNQREQLQRLEKIIHQTES